MQLAATPSLWLQQTGRTDNVRPAMSQVHEPVHAEAAIDAATFDRFRAGDQGAMLAVVEAYHRRLIGFVRLFTRNRELAEELSQEVFLCAWRQREEIYSAAKLRPWLFTLAKRKAMKEMKRKHYAVELCVEEDVLQDHAPETVARQGANLRQEDIRSHLSAAIEELGEEDRELITLRYFGEFQLKEISEAMQMPMGSVGVKLGRALSKIRKVFEKKGLSPGDFL